MARYDGNRRALMARFRGKDTKPEMVTRRLLHRLGYRFRLHRSDLPGKPDIVLPRHKAVIFVHGCFWHRHAGCRISVLPRSNPEFWTLKFEGNVARDLRARAALEAGGWRVLVVWECETKDADTLARTLSGFLANESIAADTAAGRKPTATAG